MNAKCPRCSTPITSPPNERGLVQCAGCGAWLRSVAPQAAPPDPPSPIAAAPPDPPPPVAPAPPEPAPSASTPPEPAPSASTPSAPGPSPEILALTAEIRDLRRMQAEILQLQAQILTALRSWPSRAGGAEAESASLAETENVEPSRPSALPLPRVRQRRKTVMVIDDDPVTLRATVVALEQAQVPVRSAASGQAGMALIASDKPDVIVLELDLGEPMPGRDFVNTLKATMEWVDVRLVLHTRLPIVSLQEARVQHGADDFVLKGPSSPQAVVNRVIAMFQRA